MDLVDSAMRQLLDEGFVHNRARLVASSCRVLRDDAPAPLERGAAHYLYWLSDVASSSGNRQWTAGTGNDTRPNRMLNPGRQAERFDPDGTYRERYRSGGAIPGRMPWP